jgi:LmbE family N-acetylglucosaminyl deacetylase
MRKLPRTPAHLGRTIVVSPHMDDAAFSCGELIAACGGVQVISVFAGVPADPAMRTEWDTSCGFADAHDAVSKRREEDLDGLAALSAIPEWLNFCDSQYGQTPEIVQIASALFETMSRHRPDTVLIPAGLFHSDHVLAHRAALLVYRDFPSYRWIMYEDALYRRLEGLLQKRLAVLLDEGIPATPFEVDTREYAGAKERAVSCYASQLNGLLTPGRPGHADLHARERYWQLGTLNGA